MSNINLSSASLAKLQSIAKMAYGSSGGIKGGLGRIGMIGDKAVKFNTHWTERTFGTAATDEMRASCNTLRKTLYSIANEMKLNDEALRDIRRTLGLRDDGIGTPRALLNRKTVAKVITRLNKEVNVHDGTTWGNVEIKDLETSAGVKFGNMSFKAQQSHERQRDFELATAMGLKTAPRPATPEEAKLAKAQPLDGQWHRFVYSEDELKAVNDYASTKKLLAKTAFTDPKANAKKNFIQMAMDYRRGMEMYLGDTKIAVPTQMHDPKSNAEIPLNDEQIGRFLQNAVMDFFTKPDGSIDMDAVYATPALLHQGIFSFCELPSRDRDFENKFSFDPLTPTGAKIQAMILRLNKTDTPGKLSLKTQNINRILPKASRPKDDPANIIDGYDLDITNSNYYVSSELTASISENGSVSIKADYAEVAMQLTSTENDEVLRKELSRFDLEALKCPQDYTPTFVNAPRIDQPYVKEMISKGTGNELLALVNRLKKRQEQRLSV